MRKSFKYRIYPSKKQIELINNQLFEACKLYNCALEHRIWQYKGAGKSISYKEQSSELKDIRKDGFCKLENFSACQDVLRRLDKTFKAFFTRLKKGSKPGFPRFKLARRYDTLTFPSYGDGCKIKGKKIYMQGIGDVYMRLHREVEGEIKTVSVTRKNEKYYIIFSCVVEKNVLPKTGSIVGIDMGLESLMADSNGNFIENPRWLRVSQNKLRVLQRSVSRKKKGSGERKKAIKILSKFHEKVSNQRLDFLHKLSKRIVQDNDIICIEDLNIKGMAAGMLAKSVNDAAWGIFFQLLSYKAENADKEVRKVNPRGTSQRCNKCKTEVKKDLSVRWHECPSCGESVHRDVNSAKEILWLGTNLDALTWSNSSCVAPEAVCFS